MIQDRGVFHNREHKVSCEFYTNQFRILFSDVEKSIRDAVLDSQEKSHALCKLEESFAWLEQAVRISTATPPPKASSALSKTVWNIDGQQQQEEKSIAEGPGKLRARLL